jgi:hypothetical protein
MDALDTSMEPCSETSARFPQWVKALSQSRTSIVNNRHVIPNDGERYRKGQAIAIGFVESTVNAVGKKNEQSFIESFNRTVRKECLGWTHYKPEEIPELNGYVQTFLERYHYHRPHIGLGMKPPLKR